MKCVLGRDLGRLLDNGDHADFSLIVGRRTFRCHKAILSARSPFFQAMFRNQTNQENVAGEVALEYVTPEAVSAILEYIYKDYCSELANQPADIMAAADRFCLDRLKLQCQEVLARDMTAGNVCERLRLADLYDAPKLRRKALCVIQRNRQTVLESRVSLSTALLSNCDFACKTALLQLECGLFTKQECSKFIEGKLNAKRKNSDKHSVEVLLEWNELEAECPSLAASVLKQLMTLPESRHLSNSMHDVATPAKRARLC
ncbi:unnamed protein product [Anisakis simplex]|uniref:BTB domain-containing protein n=1 Tax=Anisakis simplex TaxID=6269 RepID=A0A3P6UDG2_ANISI|nr:unnamed protein product [Anisakis simplex]